MIASLAFTACSKDWTTPESKADEFEEVALNDLKEKRDNFKWIAEADRIKENEEARLAYFADLRDYKEKAWLNSGASGGQTPFFYFWYSGDTWKSEKGIAKSWLQSLPDSLTAISLWGGLGGMRPSELTDNMKKDLEVFHEKGSTVLMCWQTSVPVWECREILTVPPTDGIISAKNILLRKHTINGLPSMLGNLPVISSLWASMGMMWTGKLVVIMVVCLPMGTVL